MPRQYEPNSKVCCLTKEPYDRYLVKHGSFIGLRRGWGIADVDDTYLTHQFLKVDKEQSISEGNRQRLGRRYRHRRSPKRRSDKSAISKLNQG